MVNCAKDCANGLSGGASFKTISPVAVSNGQNRRHKKRPAIEQVVMVRIYQSIFDYCKPPASGCCGTGIARLGASGL